MTKTKKENEPYGKCEAFSEDDLVDPWRRHLTKQPRKKTDKQMLIANIMASIEEFEEIFPPDEPDEDDNDDMEQDSTDVVDLRRRINELRRDSKWLRQRK